MGKNIGTSSSGFIRHHFPEYIPKINLVKNKAPTEQTALKRWTYLTPPAPHRTSLATLRHSLGLSALMITEQAYAGTRRCGSAVDR